MRETMLPGRDAAPRLTSYEEERARYRVTVPERFNPVLDIVEAWAADAPDDLALVSLGPQGETVAEQTVADIAADSRRVANALAGLGVRPGDPVFIMLPRVPAWYAAMLGVIRIGAVAMPGTNQLTSRDISYRIRAAEAVAVITSADGVGKVDAIEEDLPSVRERIAWDAGPHDGWHDLDAIAGDHLRPFIGATASAGSAPRDRARARRR